MPVTFSSDLPSLQIFVFVRILEKLRYCTKRLLVRIRFNLQVKIIYNFLQSYLLLSLTQTYLQASKLFKQK
jgi:hypothetical protein